MRVLLKFTNGTYNQFYFTTGQKNEKYKKTSFYVVCTIHNGGLQNINALSVLQSYGDNIFLVLIHEDNQSILLSITLIRTYICENTSYEYHQRRDQSLSLGVPHFGNFFVNNQFHYTGNKSKYSEFGNIPGSWEFLHLNQQDLQDTSSLPMNKILNQATFDV